MKIKIIAVGAKMPGWVNQGVQEYQKRMPGHYNISFQEIALGKRGKGMDLKRAIEQESKAMLAAIGEFDTVIALDVLGKSWSTEQLADELKEWELAGQTVCLLIGGPDGLSQDCLQRANKKLSLSALTLPHPLVRVVLMEQLYRAWSINANHPYHRQG